MQRPAPSFPAFEDWKRMSQREQDALLDRLETAKRRGLLTTKAVARKIAMLCSWHVGLTIPGRFLVAILPDELARARNVSEGIQILRADQFCSALFNSIWNPSKAIDELVRHASALLRSLVGEAGSSIDSVAALAGLWFGKARLHKDAPHPPTKILAILVGGAAARDSAPSRECAVRLWTVFRALVEVEHGDHMDEAREMQALAVIGEVAAEVDVLQSRRDDNSVYARLSRGLTADTADSEAFLAGYMRGVAAAGARRS